MTAYTAQSIFDTGQLLASQGVPCQMKWMSMSDLPDLRALFVSLWYDRMPAASHLLMVDNDMHFSANMVWDMLQFDKPVTGCFYAKREFPVAVVGQAMNDTDTIDDTDHGFLKVNGVGAGVLMIKRSAIDKMIARCPEIVQKTGKKPVWAALTAHGGTRMIRAFDEVDGLSEDLSFCKRWRDIGGEVWANVKHPVGHVGPYEWRIRYEEYLENKKAEKAA